MVELDLGLNLSSIALFVYSFNKYFEDLLGARFGLGALLLRKYLVAL